MDSRTMQTFLEQANRSKSYSEWRRRHSYSGLIQRFLKAIRKPAAN